MLKIAFLSPDTRTASDFSTLLKPYANHDVLIIENNFGGFVETARLCKTRHQWRVEIVELKMTNMLMSRINEHYKRDCRTDDAAIADYVVANYPSILNQ